MVEVTFTVTVQEPGVDPTCAGTVPPIKDNVLPTAVTIPPQVVVVLGGEAKFKPAGKRSSVQAGGVVERVRANEFGLKMLTLRVDVPPADMDIGLKLLLICAGRDIPWASATCVGEELT
jgi:hypothetical protein